MGKGKLAIVGAGPSGMTAGIFAARRGINVTIFDINEAFGRKILKTGNGKCNFANVDTKAAHFHGESPTHIKSVLGKFPLEDELKFLSECGITPKLDNGLYYPHSMQARSLRDCLLMELRLLGVNESPNTKVNGIAREGERYLLDTNLGVKAFDGVILATGGLASPETGSDGNGFVLARDLGHSIKRTYPALTSLICEDRFLNEAAGVRIDAAISLNISGKKYKEEGNLQIIENGISGILVMQLSAMIAKGMAEGSKPELTIDFAPGMKEAELKKEISLRFKDRGRGKSAKSALIGFMPDKLINALFYMAGIKPKDVAVNVGDEALSKLSSVIKAYPVAVKDVAGYTKAQATMGGVDFSDIDKNTLESKINKNLCFCGEVLDVCGDCGGYNLMWAFASGAVAGNNIFG